MSDDIQTILLNEIKQLRMDVQHQGRELGTIRKEIRDLRPENEKFVTVARVAKSMCVDPRTVRDWCESGKIKATQPGKDKGNWCILFTELERLKKEAQANHFNPTRK